MKIHPLARLLLLGIILAATFTAAFAGPERDKAVDAEAAQRVN